MQTKFIKTENYLLLLDLTNKPKLEDWVSIEDEIPGVPFKVCEEYFRICYEADLIVAHLPLNNTPILGGVDLLPNLFGEDRKYNHPLYSLQAAIDILKEEGWDERCGILTHLRKVEKFIKQSNQFSLEDIEKATQLATTFKKDKAWFEQEFYSKEEIIKQIQQSKLPINFTPEFEVKERFCYDCKCGFNSSESKKNHTCPNCLSYNHSGIMGLQVLKTTTDSQGQRVVQGEYKF